MTDSAMQEAAGGWIFGADAFGPIPADDSDAGINQRFDTIRLADHEPQLMAFELN